MKIERFQITIRPFCGIPGNQWRDLSVEVVADGKVSLISHTIRNSDFEDTFGAIMRESEREIRKAFKQ